MSLEGFRDPLPALGDAERARTELADLFAQPRPNVTVIVKKRRWAGSEPGAPAGAPHPDGGSASEDAGQAAAAAPRVHRLAPTVPFGTGGAAGTVTDRDDAPGPALPARRRAVRRAQQRPSPVRIVMQSAWPATVAEAPAWQRILCVPPPPVSYREVLQALDEVQSLLMQARQARALRLAAPRG